MESKTCSLGNMGMVRYKKYTTGNKELILFDGHKDSIRLWDFPHDLGIQDLYEFLKSIYEK